MTNQHSREPQGTQPPGTQADGADGTQAQEDVAPGTQVAEYTYRLESLEGSRLKRLVDAQAPYRWVLRRQKLGRTLEVGCGIGRNLAHLPETAVGVDHNATSVQVARRRGFTAFTVPEFQASRFAQPEFFDSMLVSHVVEHMSFEAAEALLSAYLKYIRTGGKVMLVCPQERGYASDGTHVMWADFEVLKQLCDSSGLVVQKHFSFPLPRFAGRAFTYNEFNVVATKP